MIDLVGFKNARLVGGYVIAGIELTDQVLTDALGREAAAQTRINASEFRITIRTGMNDRELSITLYHEILEAATVASFNPPNLLVFMENEACWTGTKFR